MSYPKFTVSYCVMGTDAGANPLGHAFIMLSEQKSENEPIRVHDAIGFYSQKSTTINPLIKGLKALLGFKIDLQDGHGVLKQEHMRELDGNGLQGTHFNVTSDQFDRLQALYTEKMASEKMAIEELNRYLDDQGMPANGHTRYITEKSWAERDNRPARLSPFHIDLRINQNGLDSRTSHACKNYALNLLLESNIIDEPMRHRLLGGPTAYAFPRFGTPSLTPIRLVSTGDRIKETSPRSGKSHHNRTWENHNPLFWVTSPEIPKTELSATTNHDQLIKNTLNRIRKIDILLYKKLDELKANSDQKSEQYNQLEVQRKKVQSLYEDFSISSRNQQPNHLKTTLLHAEKTLNIATIALTPERNNSFMLRAYESVLARNALLGLLGLLVSIAFIGIPISALTIAASLSFTGHQLYGFFKEETRHANMRADYNAFFRSENTIPAPLTTG